MDPVAYSLEAGALILDQPLGWISSEELSHFRQGWMLSMSEGDFLHNSGICTVLRAVFSMLCLDMSGKECQDWLARQFKLNSAVIALLARTKAQKQGRRRCLHQNNCAYLLIIGALNRGELYCEGWVSEGASQYTVGCEW